VYVCECVNFAAEFQSTSQGMATEFQSTSCNYTGNGFVLLTLLLNVLKLLLNFSKQQSSRLLENRRTLTLKALPFPRGYAESNTEICVTTNESIVNTLHPKNGGQI
jgi:hypothetical protein